MLEKVTGLLRVHSAFSLVLGVGGGGTRRRTTTTKAALLIEQSWGERVSLEVVCLEQSGMVGMGDPGRQPDPGWGGAPTCEPTFPTLVSTFPTLVSLNTNEFRSGSS